MARMATSVFVITARDAEGAPWGFTASAVTSLSADPPSILVCVNRGNAGAGNLPIGQAAVVHLLAADQGEVSNVFAGIHKHEGAARFDHVDWHEDNRGAPEIDGVACRLSGQVSMRHPGHSHDIVVIDLDDIAVDQSKLPLIHWNRAYQDFLADN